ncbi:hypothetical protein [Prauserella muralis]|uniref:Uncharacterized protein n=1 Tax=Prauserella muralis TaxID=588067 RepID=A0A2V4ARH8_9PSEU|nr:hypothetical protein [Prauserella muralis]PXY22634.1 hypothetical protein BAY60_22715 [Prauserella muralis]TWE28345.1 hypothetical protein FHX69_0999 [Prauserella muralis]
MIEELQYYAAPRRLPREAVRRLNDADTTCQRVELAVTNSGDRLGAEYRTRLEAAVREVRGALSKRDAELAAQRAEVLEIVLEEAGDLLPLGYASGLVDAIRAG